jgi:hypothetical protein
MHKIAKILWASVAVASLWAAAPAYGAEEPSELTGPTVTQIVVCRDVDRETRKPIGVADRFVVDDGPLTCFTRITGAVDPTVVTHVWYHEGETRSRIELPVRSIEWRTWSRKTMMPSWTGRWTVKILDAEGLVLASIDFEVDAAEENE